MKSLRERVGSLFGKREPSVETEVEPPPSPSSTPPDCPPGVEASPELEAARIAPLVSEIVARLGSSLRPGLRQREIEQQAVALLRAAKLAPRFLGYLGFPASLAISIDDEVVHGIPSDRRIEEGQLVKLQLGARTTTGSADQAWTFAVGPVSEEKQRLCAAARTALEKGLQTLRADAFTGDFGAAVEKILASAGCSSVHDFQGYAIGAKPIQKPYLPCFGRPGEGDRLEAGTLLHVHVIAAAGSHLVRTKDDGWTAITEDNSPAALYTVMVRVTANGFDLLTPQLTGRD
ncbi:MAG: M24 family metallopeptidase [Myxococcales bacterium]